MLFNSIEFLMFFPIVVAFYFLIAHRFRWVFLLLASYYFYMCWKPEYVVLIMLSTVLDYLVALKMGATLNKKVRKKYLMVSLVSNLGLLFLFKYFNFFSENANAFFAQFSITSNVPHLNLLLPIGISFYTFQTLSYSIDVYRGVKKPERHLGYFALYVSFFPQLVAGPIERSTHLMPQFFKKKYFDTDRVISGIKQMSWGFFKKVVIADNIAILVDQVYSQPTSYTGFILLLATVSFSFQIYCDFSGYSDIAIGAAKVLGFDLMKNFDRPYAAKSVAEFWKRWHISLSTWFKDYLYIPLGGSRVSMARWQLNIILTFVISGLWHGAAWTYVIWGGLHGFYLLFSNVTIKFRYQFLRRLGIKENSEVHNIFKVLITFMLVNFAWIFFRANSVSDAMYIIQHIFVDFVQFSSIKEFVYLLSKAGLTKSSLLAAIFGVLAMEYIQFYKEKQSRGLAMMRISKLWIRVPVYGVLGLSMVMFGKLSASNFIYFQF